MTEAWIRQLTRWSDAGLLDTEAVARIRAFEEAHADSNRLRWPIWLALVFGALTIGAGTLLFVSAHWPLFIAAEPDKQCRKQNR